MSRNIWMTLNHILNATANSCGRFATFTWVEPLMANKSTLGCIVKIIMLFYCIEFVYLWEEISSLWRRVCV